MLVGRLSAGYCRLKPCKIHTQVERWVRAHPRLAVIAVQESGKICAPHGYIGRNINELCQALCDPASRCLGVPARFPHIPQSGYSLFEMVSPVVFPSVTSGIASNPTMMQDASCHGPFPHTTARQAPARTDCLYILAEWTAPVCSRQNIPDPDPAFQSPSKAAVRASIYLLALPLPASSLFLYSKARLSTRWRHTT